MNTAIPTARRAVIDSSVAQHSAGGGIPDRHDAATVLRVVWYYDIFRHPLTEAELDRLCGFAVAGAVDALCAEGALERTGRHVHAPGRAAQVPRRIARTEAAERRWPAARRAAAVLAGFPWVRGVLVTGGLSKLSADPDADVDFLLLMAPGSVWTAKSALQVLRRPLPDAVRDCFCTNYLLADDHLLLEARNVFTAMELATAVPFYGPEACVALLEANRAWAEPLVPGYAWSIARARHAAPIAPNPATRALEALLGPALPWLDGTTRAGWNRYWERKYGWLPAAARAQRFQRTTSAATNHLHDFQDYVLDAHARRCAAAGLPPHPAPAPA